MKVGFVAVAVPSVCATLQQGKIRSRGFQLFKRNIRVLTPFHEYETKYYNPIKAHQQSYDSQITILADMPLFESPHVSSQSLLSLCCYLIND